MRRPASTRGTRLVEWPGHVDAPRAARLEPAQQVARHGRQERRVAHRDRARRDRWRGRSRSPAAPRHGRGSAPAAAVRHEAQVIVPAPPAQHAAVGGVELGQQVGRQRGRVDRLAGGHLGVRPVGRGRGRPRPRPAAGPARRGAAGPGPRRWAPAAAGRRWRRGRPRWAAGRRCRCGAALPAPRPGCPGRGAGAAGGRGPRRWSGCPVRRRGTTGTTSPPVRWRSRSRPVVRRASPRPRPGRRHRRPGRRRRRPGRRPRRAAARAGSSGRTAR